MSCGGRVLLEEHTAKGVGNSVVVISMDLPGLAEQLTALLRGLAYTGFASFDIKFDQRDQGFKVFEVNTRQARNNYYVTGSNMNIARLVTDDMVYGRKLDPDLSVTDPFLWHVTPRSVVRRCAEAAGLLEQADSLLTAGRSANPLIYRDDMSPQRALWLARYTASQGRMYKDHIKGEDHA